MQTLSFCGVSSTDKVLETIVLSNRQRAQPTMDRFLTRKRKPNESGEGSSESPISGKRSVINSQQSPENVEQDVQNPDQIDEDSSSSASTGGKRPATNTEPLPENVEQDKQKKSVSRKFHTEWENLYLVSEYKTKPICLICRHEFTQIKKFSFERHFNTTHIAFSQKYPESSKKND